jgi:hypothetical protein
MPVRKTDRRVGEVIGVIRPGELLDTDAVFEVAGIGRVQLAELRRAGKIEPRKFANRNWYKADDIIALILEAKR